VFVAHISRKELKKDEVRDTFAQGAQVVLEHQKLTIILLAVAIVVAAGVFGWMAYSQRQAQKASAAFDDAMTVFESPVGAPQQPNQLTYADDNAKFAAAARKLSDVATKYPRTHPGRLAGYFEALSYEKLNKNDQAKKLLQSMTDSSDEDVASMARFELAQLDDRMGQGDEAERLYQQLMAKPTDLVAKPIVMLALAEHYSLKDPTQAAKLYGQIKSDYPDTPIAQQADQELSLLPSKS
jgi:predicted negative regulator of RcsB-dependent stress response